MGYGLEYQQPFFEDPTGAGDLLDEDEDEDEDDGWNGAYLPSTVEQTHSSGVAASTSPCGTYVSFFSTPSELVGPDTLPLWTLSDSESHASPAGSPSADFAAHGESLGDRHLRTLQISYEAVSEGALSGASCPTGVLADDPEPPGGLGGLRSWLQGPDSHSSPCAAVSRADGSRMWRAAAGALCGAVGCSPARGRSRGDPSGAPSGKGPLQASAQGRVAVF